MWRFFNIKVELGVVPIPKSANPDRLLENISIFDFKLTDDERKVLDSVNTGQRQVKLSDAKHAKYWPFGLEFWIDANAYAHILREEERISFTIYVKHKVAFILCVANLCFKYNRIHLLFQIFQKFYQCLSVLIHTMLIWKIEIKQIDRWYTVIWSWWTIHDFLFVTVLTSISRKKSQSFVADLW